MSELKFSFFNYLNHLGLYDYIAFIWLIFIFLILLVLSVVIVKKSIIFSLLTILFSFILLFTGPFALKYFLNKTLRPVKIDNITSQKLHFSDTLIVDFVIENLSKKPYIECLITTKVYKPSKSKLKKFVNELKPIRYRTILDKRELKAGDKMKNRVIFYNFSYNKDINISASAECYGKSR